MRAEVLLLLLALLAVSLPSRAEEPEQDSDTTASDLPDLDLLEFLGEFETADGQWLDPFELSEQDSTARTEAIVQ